MPAHLSKRLASLADSETMAIGARAAQLQASGVPVIGFGAGEPDFPTPPHVVAAAQEAATDPVNHRYSSPEGLPELREAVASVAASEMGFAADPAQVTITNGAKGAVFGVMAALLDPGDEVLLPVPYWVTYPAAAELFGAVVRTVPTRAVEGFRVTPERLDAVFTERSRLLVLCSPSNPTGTVYTADELAALGEWAADRGVWVLSDEIYRNFVYGDSAYVSMAAAAPATADRLVVVDGVAKTFAMTGWRVGWLIAPPEIASAVGRLQSHSTSNVANVSQRAALAALTGPRDTVDAMVAAFARRRSTMQAMLEEIDGVVCPEPDGAFYTFPSVEGLLGRPLGGMRPETSLELAEALITEAHIAVVPGEAFGMGGHVRLSFALGDDELVEGLKRWQEAAG